MWAAFRNQRWKMCQYCKRNIFYKEIAYRLVGQPSYVICKDCRMRGESFQDGREFHTMGRYE